MIELRNEPKTEPPNRRWIVKECCSTCKNVRYMSTWCDKHQVRVYEEEICDDYC